MGAVEGDDVFPRLVRHFTGETVVAEPPRRLVVLATGQFDAALSLGVVPAGAAVKKGTPGPVPVYLAERYPLHRAAFAEVVSVGGRAPVDLSAVAAARPDLIVGTSSGAHGRVATELAEIAPTVLTGGGGFGWKRDFLLLAEALGKRTAARQVLRRYDERVARLRPVLAGVGAVSFVRFGPKGLEQYGLRSFVGSIATDLGLSRPATQGFAATSQLVPLADTA